MKKLLPDMIPAVSTLIEALNEKNFNLAISCFTSQTIVRDGGYDYTGIEKMTDWWHQRATLNSQMKIGDAFEEDGFVVVKITGNENLSRRPVAFDFRFTFVNDKISTLDIS